MNEIYYEKYLDSIKNVEDRIADTNNRIITIFSSILVVVLIEMITYLLAITKIEISVLGLLRAVLIICVVLAAGFGIRLFRNVYMLNRSLAHKLACKYVVITESFLNDKPCDFYKMEIEIYRNKFEGTIEKCEWFKPTNEFKSSSEYERNIHICLQVLVVLAFVVAVIPILSLLCASN